MSVSLKNQMLKLLQPYTEYMQLDCGHLVPEPQDCKTNEDREESYFCRRCDKNKSKIYSKDFGQNKYPKEVIYRLYNVALNSNDDGQLVRKFRKTISQLDIKGFPETIKKGFESISAMNLTPRTPTPVQSKPVTPPNPFMLPIPAKAQVDKVLVELENSDLLSFCVSKRRGGIYFELIVKSPSELAEQLKSEGIRFETIDIMGFYESGDINAFKKIWRKIHGLIGFDDANQISNLVSPYLVAREAIPPLPPAWDPVPFAPLQEASELFMSDNSEKSEVLLRGNGKSGLIMFSVTEDKKSKKIRIELETNSRCYIGEGLEDLKTIWQKVKDLEILDQRDIDRISKHISKMGTPDAELDLASKESLNGGSHSSYGSFGIPLIPPFQMIKEYEEGGEILAEFISDGNSALPSAAELDAMSAEELSELFDAIDLSNQPD